eukprot:11871696-Ditylum_brightwellii.AAC.1
MNALLQNAGSTNYVHFTLFTPREIEQHMSVYILNGPSPSLDIQLKSKSQKNEFINGSNVINAALGSSTAWRHKEFKCFFYVRHPRQVTPPRKTHPDFKVVCWLKHINDISMKA